MSDQQPLRPQQVHVSLWRRLILSLEKYGYGLQVRLHAWADFERGDRYTDGYVKGFNRISELYDELITASAACVTGIGATSQALTELKAVIDRHASQHLGPPSRRIMS